MNFRGTLKYLENLIIYGIKIGTEYTKIVAQNLGNPHSSFPSILIGGTNGKGSTAAYIESILRESGYKTGLFTSPHLIDVRERIRINGDLISKKYFSSIITRIKNIVLELKAERIIDEAPTFFEVLTLASFIAFQEKNIDIAVVEVGMGGKNDCTNILEPLISIVTNVSFDHQQYLGRSIRKIAEEKSGIFRKDKFAVIGKTSPISLKYLKENGERICAKIECMKDFKIATKNGECFFSYREKIVKFPLPPLLGRHQIDNASLAVFVCEKLKELGFEILEEGIKKGIQNCKWEGRIQKIMQNPITYIDGAHNIDGIKKLKDFAQNLKGRKILVFSALKDKPIKKMVKILQPYFSEIIFTRVNMKRGAERCDFQKILKNRKFLFEEEPISALTLARKKAGKDGVVIVCGSLYLVGEILKKIKKQKGTLCGTGL
ncbi:MAG: bifunctional folylpolyglutamate synthase/dihydrofolate synthase [Acidobacteria bacterium]|nr:bifunctional folylpolyglutamate synthase/dihydrofolate synthase [Acidobacteriota bacterium]